RRCVHHNVGRDERRPTVDPHQLVASLWPLVCWLGLRAARRDVEDKRRSRGQNTASARAYGSAARSLSHGPPPVCKTGPSPPRAQPPRPLNPSCLMDQRHAPASRSSVSTIVAITSSGGRRTSIHTNGVKP